MAVHTRRSIWSSNVRVVVGRARPLVAGLLTAVVVTSAACVDPNEGGLPPDVQDPAKIQTANGAIGYYRGVLVDRLPTMLERLLYLSALFTDEFIAVPVPLGAATRHAALDSRQAPEFFFSFSYAELHRLRGEARDARGFLTAYAADSSSDLAGHMYAIEGYADLLLADHFCSGIPLSTVDFQGDYTVASGSTTHEVYTTALEFFDNALELGGDSARLQHFAAVGKGRALLALRRYAEAATAVAAVPDGFVYQVPPLDTDLRFLVEYSTADRLSSEFGLPSMADGEDLIGYNYRSSEDPRTLAALMGTDQVGNQIWHPQKYPKNGTFFYTISSGIEARLIEAEAALQAGSPAWLTTLNALRTDGTFDTTGTDTLWHAGSGGVEGLAPLDDPGNAEARLDLVFRERAFWLYLTGIRQGDMRRLVREYGRTPESVYPSGTYGAGGTYGTQIVVQVPESEQQLNSQYNGCINLGA